MTRVQKYFPYMHCSCGAQAPAPFQDPLPLIVTTVLDTFMMGYFVPKIFVLNFTDAVYCNQCAE